MFDRPSKALLVFASSLMLLLVPCCSLVNILDEGAVPHTDTLVTQFHNAEVIKRCIAKANSSLIDRVVKIPSHTFYSMPISISNIHNISIIIEGKLSASKNVLKWPKKPNSAHYEDFIYISDSSHIEISGGGRIDGRGYHWWMIEWLRLKKLRPLNSARPHMLNIERCEYFKIHDLILKNSPCFHIRTYVCFHFDIYSLDIKVNTTAQLNLAKLFAPTSYLTTLEGIIPLFPLNTDGIDPAGKYFHIYNITVQNYDDVVVPKPSHAGTSCNCTEFMLIENITVRLGVGLSIGSVPPNTQHNCIRNIVFRNAYFMKPFKGIYIKTNPGNAGTGEIVNVTYSNMYMDQPIWWAIYLGPQQQKQPLGGGPGCMLYPFDPRGTCATQPRISIRNIVLENIEVHNSLLFPIVLRCN